MAPKPDPQSNAKPETPKVHVHHGFDLIVSEYEKLRELVQKIQEAATTPATGVDGSPATDASESTKKKNDKRAVDMLVSDIKYIKDNIESLKNIDTLEDPGKVKKADVLVQFLMDATKKRTADDFKKDTVNLKKLLQIIAKLKLWVLPPPPPEDDKSKSKDAAKKKEESPFVSSKEKDKAASEIVEGLFGLRCNQWGMDGLLKSYDKLNHTEKLCLLCFSAFECEVEKVTEAEKVTDQGEKVGENEYMISKSLKIKKRILIHWWVAEGLIDLYRKSIADGAPNPNPNPDGASNSNPDQSPQQDPMTVEEIGEEILKVLKEKGFIDPVIKAAQESSRVVMHPFVHSFVTALSKRAGFFDFSDKDGKLTPSFGLSQRACLVKWPDKESSCKVWEKFTDDRKKLKRFETVQTLFNVNEPIIDIKPEWFSKMTNLSILHLGSWRSEAAEHIEVEDTKFMEDLKTMVKMRLFSLQGVSTIMKLSDSVCKLENLVILDLRECHNLEELPVDIGCLKSLTHLDITNCHLLTKLPKGICLLSKLEVLKGFVIYDQAGGTKDVKKCFLRHWCRKARRCVIHEVLRFKNKEECTLKDLEKLKELRQLSIVVNVKKFPREEEVQVFKEMRKLRKLKIAWEKNFKNEVEKPEERNANAQQESAASGSPPGKKQDGENPSATGAGKPEARDADAQQESASSGSPPGKKQDGENPSATGAGKPEARDADAQQESASSGSPPGKKQDGENPSATGAGKPEARDADAQQESASSGSPPGKKQDGENPSATGAGKPEARDADAQQESASSGSPPGKKQDGENPSATGAGKPEARDADAQQESASSGSPPGKKQGSGNLPTPGAGGPETRNVDDQQESSANCCLSRKCCRDSRVVKTRSEWLDQIHKLELWCFPETKAPDWLHPDKLKNLKKLYIKGGELGKLPRDGDSDSDEDKIKWENITTLRFKYLCNLEIKWLEFKAMFPKLEYLEKSECVNLLHFPCDQEGVWKRW